MPKDCELDATRAALQRASIERSIQAVVTAVKTGTLRIAPTSAPGDLPERARTARPLTAYAFWVRPGWLPIVFDAARQLQELGVQVPEAREKLGELRIHVSPTRDFRRDDVQAVIAAAREKASRTCDICGGAGSFFASGGARRVRCVEHVDFEQL